MTKQGFENDLSLLPKEAHSFLERAPAFFINGSWHNASDVLPVFDPSSARQISEIGAAGSAVVGEAVRAAKTALKSPAWAQAGPVERERLIRRLADLIEQKTELFAHLDTVDSGMALWFSQAINVAGSCDVLRYYSGWPTKLAGRTIEVSAPPGMGSFSGMTMREPVGVVAAIVPWNVPLMMAVWKLAPALAAGCTVVLKPSEESSLSALALADCISEVGFPPGVVNVITGTGKDVGEPLATHPDVAKISFTGSTATGRHLAELAGRHLKKLTLELGGKSPTIIFDDADLDRAVEGAATAIFLNSGQVCVAGSRLYVKQNIYSQVVERLSSHVATIPVGAGLSSGAFMGPLISHRQRTRVSGYVESAKQAGMGVHTAADLSGHAGYYFSPTLVTCAPHQHPITQDEVFGPVLGIYPFADEEEVIALANDTVYGLAANLWTRDIGRVHRVSAALQCGKVTVNSSGFPYPGLPEGGYKASGFGRDLGPDAVEQCLQTKTVLIHVN
jgi:phenylacetaldehyde dehydrogenase